MFKASLKNNNIPELGTVTVEFPIPEAQYEETIRALNGIQSGAVVEQDCFVADIGTADCPALERLIGTMANVDELDRLGKQLESFDRYELLQFNAAVERFGLSAADELIDLSFCAREVTVVSCQSLIKTIDYPTTPCNALYRIRGQGANGIAKPIYYLLQSSKHFITEARDSEFFPYLLDGIHLRRIRWNVKQLYVFRDMKLVRLVPCCTITTQQDQIIRVLLGQFLKKYVHTSRIAIRHNKKTGASRYWFNSSVCIPIFTNVMARYRWTNALFTPAVFGLIDSSESCFILEHKSYFLMWMTRIIYIIL